MTILRLPALKEVINDHANLGEARDLGGLADLLPSLRTGEGLFLGEAMAIPSRVRVRKALKKPVGDDPKLPETWQNAERPSTELYTQALANWRAQSTSAIVPAPAEDSQEG